MFIFNFPWKYACAYTVPDPAVSFPCVVTKTVWLFAGQVHNIVFVLFSVCLKENGYGQVHQLRISAEAEAKL